MIKVTVLYGQPDEPTIFDKYFTEIHTIIAMKIPNLERFDVTKFLPGPDGSTPSWYRMAELYFKDEETLQAAFRSEEGMAATGDIPNFATGGTTMLIGSWQNLV
ncbi:EthD family reductase [Foetidibacter luteolus]|uniref:EthD family reductase n=1 Tax=Foetidibacter luteolus TaxID=2608880 RepID=UPI00129A6259|nr:EthD family reductase [Foetidibacter luteolus]